jgi:hypothetical protein
MSFCWDWIEPTEGLQLLAATEMGIERLQTSINQVGQSTRDPLSVVLEMQLQLVGIALECLKPHQTCKGLVEVEDLLRCLVRQPGVRHPDMFG